MAKTNTAAVERFAGFADGEARFFRALARNQSREWFAAHRDEYDQGWLRPMQALLHEARERIAPFFTREDLAPPKVFRIHRDVRFSKDKSPYKTHIGGLVPIAGTGGGPGATCAVYFHVAADELFLASGQYVMDGSQLQQFRAALLDERRGNEVGRLLGKLTRAGFTVGSYDELQRVPRGFDPDHPRAALLKRKGLIVAAPPPARSLLVSRKLVDHLVAQVKRAAPLVEWLAAVTA